MKKCGFIILSIVFLISCRNSLKQEKEWLEVYLDALGKFPPNDILHFPFDFTGFDYKKVYVYYPQSSHQHAKTGVILDTRVEEKEFTKIYDLIGSQEIPRRLISDNEIFLIGDTINDYSSNEKKVPIPCFSDVIDEFGLGRQRLSGREEVYIIESGKGKYFGSEYLENNYKIPYEWRHGMSRGVTIDSSRRRLVYWLIYW